MDDEDIPWGSAVKKNITAFHTEGFFQWHNMQTRFLAGREAMQKEEIDASDLELAVYIIKIPEEFHLAGNPEAVNWLDHLL